MPVLNKSGWFLCRILEWGVREAKESQAVSVTLKLETRAEWDGAKWVETPTCEVFGDWYIYKKDGQVNQTGLDQLFEARIWLPGDGPGHEFTRFADEPPAELEVVVQVQPDEYNGKTRYKPNWIHVDTHVPGAGGIANRATNERLKELQSRAAALRAAIPKQKDPTPF